MGQRTNDQLVHQLARTIARLWKEPSMLLEEQPRRRMKNARQRRVKPGRALVRMDDLRAGPAEIAGQAPGHRNVEPGLTPQAMHGNTARPQIVRPDTGLVEAQDHQFELPRERKAHLHDELLRAAWIQAVHHVRKPRTLTHSTHRRIGCAHERPPLRRIVRTTEDNASITRRLTSAPASFDFSRNACRTRRFCGTNSAGVPKQ